MELKRRLYSRGSSYETTIPKPLLFSLDLTKRQVVRFVYDDEKGRWYIEFEEQDVRRGEQSYLGFKEADTLSGKRDQIEFKKQGVLSQKRANINFNETENQKMFSSGGAAVKGGGRR